jgi:hypothetical protein
VKFVVDKVALGQVFFEYIGFPCKFSFHRLLHTHHLSSGAGTIGQLVAVVPSGLSLTQPQENFISNFRDFEDDQCWSKHVVCIHTSDVEDIFKV